MKVAVITNTYPPRIGGLEQHIQHLALGLAQLGHSVSVLTLSSHSGQHCDGAVPVLVGKSNFPIEDVVSFPAPGTLNRITKWITTNQIDVISTHTRFFPMSYIGIRVGEKTDTPVIHTEHGAGYVQNNSMVIAAGSRLVDNTMGRYVLSHASKVLAVSEESAQFAQRLGAQSPSVFYNAIDPIEPAPEIFRPQHFVFVGRLVEGKGWDTFLDLIAQLRSSGLNVDGEVLGDGPDMAKLQQSIDRLHLRHFIQVRGECSHSEVTAALRASTLIYPSTLSEGFGIVLLEAVSAGAGVVAYSTPGSVMLSAEGLPVVVTPQRTLSALYRATLEYLQSVPAAATKQQLQRWTWPTRIREYDQYLHAVVRS
ncbi:MAG: glycosyltransferase family 4 protein [Ancrocorticia sp.]|jgi:glycosyltransferase involved in cell wall biosynthesis|nr:glycosyltransferase family 4 protein [Ancrocorticia sp.]